MGEPYDGFHVLDELRSPLGVVLWQSLRDAELWSSTRPEGRRRLFVRTAAERRAAGIAMGPRPEPELEGALAVFTRLVENALVKPEELSEACQAISRWAAERGHTRTAIAFAEGAAMVAPDKAGPAYAVGLLARRSADYRRAESWFRRSLGLGRRTGDWKHYALACIGLGNLFMQRGDYPTARGWFIKALRACRRHGLWSVKPMALHDLFCVAARGGHVEDAERIARSAFRAYGRRHPRVLALVHDVARFWVLQGYHARALPVFQAIIPHIRDRRERLLALSNLARSAAVAGSRSAFADAWQEVWRLVDRSDEEERVAEALVSLAEGAAILGDRDRAGLAATHAMTVAERRGEAEQRLAAEGVLVMMRRYRRPPPGAGPSPIDPAIEKAADALAGDFVEALSAEGLEP